MPYPRRVHIPGATSHLMSRCIERKPLLNTKNMKQISLNVIRRAQNIYEFKLISFALMDNHFHFIIQTEVDGPTISRIMQYIKARIAEIYNRIMDRTGPFWNERFKDVIIEKQENPMQYLLWLLWYLAFNPVRAGKCSDPRTYEFSSIKYYLKEEIPSSVKITRHRYFNSLGMTFAERLRNFLLYEDAYRKRINLMLA